MVSQVPDSAATIIPFDVESRVHLLHARNAARLAARRVLVAGNLPNPTERAPHHLLDPPLRAMDRFQQRQRAFELALERLDHGQRALDLLERSAPA